MLSLLNEQIFNEIKMSVSTSHENTKFASEFVDFLNLGCTAFHAVAACCELCDKAQFKKLSEKESMFDPAHFK